MNILYIEDEPITRDLVTKMLLRHKHTVHVASNGVSGLKLFLEKNPDLIIADLSMPAMSGAQMINMIRKHSVTVPIIITTAYKDECDQILSSANGLVFKPFLEADICKAIANIANIYHLNN